MRFIILATHRTGSTLLESYLNCHTNTPCSSELFQAKVSHPLSVPRYIEWQRFYRKSISRYISKFVPAGGGFKLMYGQLSKFPDLQRYLIKHKILIIHIQRENLLRRYLSYHLAKKTDSWSSNTSEYKLSPIKLNPENILNEIREMQKKVNHHRHFQKTNPYLDITYEDLSEFPDRTLSRIWNTLNEKPVQLKTELVKQNPYPLVKMISNYQEIETALKGTSYEWMMID